MVKVNHVDAEVIEGVPYVACKLSTDKGDVDVVLLPEAADRFAARVIVASDRAKQLRE